MVVEPESVSAPSKKKAIRNKGSEQVLVRWNTAVLLFCKGEFKEPVQGHKIF